MFFQDLTFEGETRGRVPCLRRRNGRCCDRAHPIRGGLELHTFECDQCGSIEPRIVTSCTLR
jgi:hypothetical protein